MSLSRIATILCKNACFTLFSYFMPIIHCYWCINIFFCFWNVGKCTTPNACSTSSVSNGHQTINTFWAVLMKWTSDCGRPTPLRNWEWWVSLIFLVTYMLSLKFFSVLFKAVCFLLVSSKLEPDNKTTPYFLQTPGVWFLVSPFCHLAHLVLC